LAPGDDGHENGVLGYPIDEFVAIDASTRRQFFQHGFVTLYADGSTSFTVN